MPADLLLLTVLGLLAVVVCHELTHVLIAKAHGHQTVCIAVNPIGVAVVFEDTPSPRYWGLQVLLPLAVTAVISYLWLYALASAMAVVRPGFGAAEVIESLPLVVSMMAVLTSGGDILGFIMESRRPVWGEDRIVRDLRILRRLPSLVYFTAYGRDRWSDSWESLARPDAAVVPLVAISD